ncbi:hypothetical protein lerEdw1_013579 [Lerista edwardsae]|nr:hypothetical protein lerEdw1_013579 [Lerista edwardsae]
MAAAAGLLQAGSPVLRGRFRGCLLGALLGDCLGGGFEALETVQMAELLCLARSLQPEPAAGGGGGGREEAEAGAPRQERRRSLSYSDDTAMAHSLARSLLAKRDFDEVDMAKRFAEEYKDDPDRGYGTAVMTVFKKLLRPKCRDVFEPAREQFNGKGSYGNGGAMRVASISLVYPNIQDVKKFAKLSSQLTHANSLGYNGGVLQALAVHYALQGTLNQEQYLEQLIGHMEDVEADDKSVTDARVAGYEEFPFSKRLKKIKEFLEQSTVPKSDVILELVILRVEVEELLLLLLMAHLKLLLLGRRQQWEAVLCVVNGKAAATTRLGMAACTCAGGGNGIAALHSVPTAIYAFLRCMKSHPDIPEDYNSLQRTLLYCISLGGDTDTIATMAGAIAGAYYGEEQVPPSWKTSCESFEETEKLADGLYELYCQRQ